VHSPLGARDLRPDKDLNGFSYDFETLNATGFKILQIGDNESRRGRFSLSSRNEAAHWEQAGPGLANGDSIEQGEDKND